MRPVGGAKQLERRRERPIGLLKDGQTPVEVARQVRVDRRSVRRWNATFRKAGIAGLAARPVPGRPAKLTARQRAHVETLLLRGAEASGFESDLWTCSRVAHVIGHRQFRVPAAAEDSEHPLRVQRHQVFPAVAVEVECS